MSKSLQLPQVSLKSALSPNLKMALAQSNNNRIKKKVSLPKTPWEKDFYEKPKRKLNLW